MKGINYWIILYIYIKNKHAYYKIDAIRGMFICIISIKQKLKKHSVTEFLSGLDYRHNYGKCYKKKEKNEKKLKNNLSIHLHWVSNNINKDA